MNRALPPRETTPAEAYLSGMLAEFLSRDEGPVSAVAPELLDGVVTGAFTATIFGRRVRVSVEEGPWA